MKTYLLAWNPKRWQWDNIVQMSDDVKIGKIVLDRWSSGVSKRPQKGDRFFLIRLGEEPKGIIASGSIERDSFVDLHWNEEKSSLGETTNYVEIKSEMHWDTQMSGVQIPNNVANELETLWTGFNNSSIFTFPEELDATQEEIFEGAVHRILVNSYERNPVARRKCIEHYGAACQVCNVDFEKVYGEIGKGFIHVHHLKQISEIGEAYEVDPIQDLQPVCPNCHAMIHKRKPPYTIEEMKTLLRR